MFMGYLCPYFPCILQEYCQSSEIHVPKVIFPLYNPF